VHDLTHYELSGLATVMIASTEFVGAARKQAEALGMPELAELAVYVPHPIQDATDDEMRAKARAALGSVLAALTAPAAGEGS
jgi:hypothetical protein